MPYRAILLSLMIGCSIAMADGFQPSVWQQMQEGQTSTVAAKIKTIEVLDHGVSISFAKKDGRREVTETAKLCDDFSTSGHDNAYFDSEERRAAFFRERMELIREAYKTGETVELAYRGPWNACLQSVRLSKSGKKRS